MKLSHIVNTELQILFADAEYFARLAAMSWANNTCYFQLVHEASCTIITDGELALYHAGGALLSLYNQSCNFLEHGIQVLHVHIWTVSILAFHGNRGQRSWAKIALLACNVFGDGFHLGGVNKGTLNTNGFGTSAKYKHITLTNQLLCSGTVQNGTAIHHGTYLEGHTTREVGLDGTGNDIGGRTLGGYNHMYAYGTSQLGYTANG